MLSPEFSESPDRRGINLAEALQNKQGTGRGVPDASPMLKLDREIESVNTTVSQWDILPFSVVIPPLFMKEEDDPLFIESW